MPFSGPSSYLPTIDEFLAHWALVDTALGTNLQLSGGYKRSNLVTERGNLATKITAATTAGSNAQAASEDRDVQRAAIKERMRQFNQTVRGQIPNTQYPGMLPKIPNFAASPGRWMTALDQMKNAWTRINTDAPPPTGFTPPLILSGPYALAAHTTADTAMRTAFTLVVTTVENFEAGVEDRDMLYRAIRQRCIQYRAAVQGTFPAGHALILSLPPVSPAPGSTPRAVRLTGVWDAGLVKASLTWPATDDARVTEYEVRACFGSRYRTQDEMVLSSVPLGTEHFEDDTGLGASGAFVWYKVYTMTATGNEKGSNAVKVTRP